MQLLDCATATGQRLGMPDEQAERYALETVRDMAALLGGCQFYLPKGEALGRALRDREIYRLAGRVSAEALAQRYQLSMKQVWQIQREQTALHVKDVQRVLF
ncbi:MAG: hypothetical protein KDI44_14250 [Thiothrix sp.]|nr:hypothetical protein [Thiothrix sp.]